MGPMIPAPLSDPWPSWIHCCSALRWHGGRHLDRSLGSYSGYEAYRAPDVWTAVTGDFTGSFAEYVARIGEAPIQMIVTDARNGRRSFLALSGSTIVAETRHQALWVDEAAKHRFDTDWLSIHYLVGSVLHRLAQLVESYARAVRLATGIASTFSSTRFTLSEPAIYYEFESTLSEVVRLYEFSRRVVWKLNGSGGSRPRSFSKLLKAIGGAPEWMKASETEFDSLKEYRDCFTHDVSSAEPAPRTIFENGPKGWHLRALAPDNPEVRSHQRFRFEEERDALRLAFKSVTAALDYVEALDRKCSSSHQF